jgi:hypothetical protein
MCSAPRPIPKQPDKTPIPALPIPTSRDQSRIIFPAPSPARTPELWKHLIRSDRVPEKLNQIIALVAALVFSGAAALAQPAVDTQSKDNPSGSVMQPQGMTGPINTKPGGAPASSPQGETPAGMQAAPKGSSETIRTDKHGIAEGTPKN